MKNKELYLRSINILLDAYNNRKLIHGNPCGCAVGNLVKASCSTLKPAINLKTFEYEPNWWFGNIMKGYCGDMNVEANEEDGFIQIASTGYSLEEIKQIEAAFEDVDEEEGQFLGLTAVLNTLAEIHEIDKEEEIIQENQEKLE